ncbi:MAG: glycosyltransferase [Nostoc sp. LLA-1]|nr:glycosyltransferase [Cyanocohniella sp. LLY]
MNEVNKKIPKISVVIPAYNSEKTIKATIYSVLNQTFTDFELIIINDGSEDSTLDVISNIKDSRIQVFSYENAGGNVSRNRGLHYAIGEFVSFLDADDIWTSDKLASQLQALQQNVDAKVAYSWTDYIDENGNFLVSGTHTTVNGDVYEKLLVNNFLENGSNPLICREALIKLGGFDESLSAAQDWDMWLRLADQYSFVAVSSVQILYRVSGNSVSSNLIRQEKCCLQVLERAYYAKPLMNQNVLNFSLTNLYKYLTCKALQAPLNKEKGAIAARFIWRYFINDSLKIKHIKFTFKLLLKIFIILILPIQISTVLLTKTKTNFKEKSSTPE